MRLILNLNHIFNLEKKSKIMPNNQSLMNILVNRSNVSLVGNWHDALVIKTLFKVLVISIGLLVLKTHQKWLEYLRIHFLCQKLGKILLKAKYGQIAYLIENSKTSLNWKKG